MPCSQEDVDKRLSEYFSRLDPLSAGILAEIEQVKRAYTKDKWHQLPHKQQEEAIDRHFVPENVRRMYRKNSRARSSSSPKRPTEGVYPQRQIKTGQGYRGKKKNIRDEFSAPFHWETQSQIDQFYVLNEDEQQTAKPTLIKTAKDNADFMGAINAQLATASSDFKNKTPISTSRPSKIAPSPPSRATPPSSAKKPSSPRRAKPPPPPRAASTRRISDVSEISSSMTSTPTPPPSRLDNNNNGPTIKNKSLLPNVKETVVQSEKEESSKQLAEESEAESQNFSDTEELIKIPKQEYNFLLNW
ncbi:unnamed protein product [Oikopleura dioica]|uniref:DUF4706 domain-containing protein n=1 Tax=Oikopleura dioica TaxID=34765 RepID=E4XJZ6_OIKDI|nr:unnamed protein product [Oikopleura dioica]